MSVLRSLEHFAEELIEGSTRRIFRTQLQPVQIAKSAGRALEESRSVGPSGPLVANVYEVRLNPSDYARLADMQTTVADQVRAFLDRHAQQRGLVPVGRILVLLAPDAVTRRGTVGVLARFVDPSPDEAVQRAPHAAGSTRRMPARTGSARITEPGARLLLETGEVVKLSDARTTIGRALDNDVAIADERVSRYHAAIERRADVYVVRDLESVNGTLIQGRPVREQTFSDGDELSLGGFLAVFRKGVTSPDSRLR